MITGDFRCFIYDGDRIRVSGCTFGYGDSNPYLLYRGKNHLVIKEPGTNDWISRGESGYHSTEYHLIRVEWVDDIEFKSQEVIETVKPGRRWKAAKEHLIGLVKHLEREQA